MGSDGSPSSSSLPLRIHYRSPPSNPIEASPSFHAGTTSAPDMQTSTLSHTAGSNRAVPGLMAEDSTQQTLLLDDGADGADAVESRDPTGGIRASTTGARDLRTETVSIAQNTISSKDQAALGFLSGLSTSVELVAQATRNSSSIQGGVYEHAPLTMDSQAQPETKAQQPIVIHTQSQSHGQMISFHSQPHLHSFDDGPNDTPIPSIARHATLRTSTSARMHGYTLVQGGILSRAQSRNTDATGAIADQLSDVPITVVTPNGSPLGLFSVLPYKGTKALVKTQSTRARERIGFGVAIEAVKRKKQTAESFAHLLAQEFTLCEKGPENSSYNPYFLDDPDLKMGRHKTVITLPCFLGTIIQPSKPSEIQRELNEHFKETHPGIDSTITLSQIRGLKKSLLEVAQIQDLELSSVATAYVYFEKLVIKNVINKANRKVMGAVCLLLAVKINDPKEVNYANLLETVDKVLDVSPKDVYNLEFHVYAALSFTLFLPLWEVLPHLERIHEAAEKIPE
ncbi:hypothetical protein BSLG_003312 [Batrachochytrium salamandrivorans]|nr:hypothetical protein BSLG_003312 [Batrachochytrium salamandrivorans]